MRRMGLLPGEPEYILLRIFIRQGCLIDILGCHFAAYAYLLQELLPARRS